MSTCQWRVMFTARRSGECGQKAVFSVVREAKRPVLVCRHHLARTVESFAENGQVQVIVL